MNLKSILNITLLLLFCSTAFSQKSAQTLLFKKGEVLDILLLSKVPDPALAFERYKKTAFPVAYKHSYRPQPGFTITHRYLGGTNPAQFIFGKWDSLDKRESFLSNITKEVPDFHQQRNALFSYFNLIYFEMPNDISFTIHPENLNLVTSFWAANKKESLALIDTWKQEVKKQGGTILLSLENGTSPPGYLYKPDNLIITQWNSKNDLEAFIEAHPLAYYETLENVEQFVIK